MTSQFIYYLPGRGGRLTTGLGLALMRRGYDVTGRETVGEFRDCPFRVQVETVASDLQAHFWHEDAFVVANSFGAYLFLHAQAQMAPYIGNLLLLSPIVGDFASEEARIGFLPPYADKLNELVQAGQYPAPKKCQIHVGEEDWQSHPAHVIAFGKMIGASVAIVPAAGHLLGKGYVSSVLDGWLSIR